MLGKHTLDPNEKTDLKVTFDTAGRPGDFQKSVYFSTSIPGQEKLEVFSMKGTVKEAPAAKIQVSPRRLAVDEQSSGQKQEFSVTNPGSLPLVITRIYSKEGEPVYFDGTKEGNIVLEPGQTKKLELQLRAGEKPKQSQEFIVFDSNAKNAGKTGYFIIIEYGTSGK
jgi:hypothetical protein